GHPPPSRPPPPGPPGTQTGSLPPTAPARLPPPTPPARLQSEKPPPHQDASVRDSHPERSSHAGVVPARPRSDRGNAGRCQLLRLPPSAVLCRRPGSRSQDPAAKPQRHLDP